MANVLVVNITGDESDLLAALDRSARGVDDFGDKSDGIAGKITGAFGGVAGVIGGLFATAAAGFSIAGMGQVISETARLRAQLVTVTGDVGAAANEFKMLEAFAAQTPFSIEEVTQAFVKLSAYGLSPSQEALRSYGNTAAAMGKSLDQFVEAVADAATGEFERLKEFGIRASAEGNKVRMTFHGVTTEIGRDAGSITKYLEGIGNSKFASAMERQAATIVGASSNMKDAVSSMVRAIGDSGLEQMLVGIYNGIRDAANAASSAIRMLSGQTKSTTFTQDTRARIDDLKQQLADAKENLSQKRSGSLMGLNLIGTTQQEIRAQITAIEAQIADQERILKFQERVERNASSAAAQARAPAAQSATGNSKKTGDFIGTGKSRAQNEIDNYWSSLLYIEQQARDRAETEDANYWSSRLYMEQQARGQMQQADQAELDAARSHANAIAGEYLRAYESTRTPTEQYIADLEAAQATFNEFADADLFERSVAAANRRMLEQTRQTSNEWEQIWSSAGNRFAAGIGDSVASVVMQQSNMADAMRNITRGVLQQVISSLVEIGVKKTMLWAMDKAQFSASEAMKAAGTATTVAQAGTVAVAAAPAAAATATFSFGTAAVIGLGALIAIYAASKSLAGMAHDGIGSVPREGTWLLDKGERVVNDRDNKKLTQFLDGQPSGGGQTVQINMPINLSAADARGIDQMIMSRRAMIQNMALSAVRDAMRQSGMRPAF